MPKKYKQERFETSFADNFRPSWWQKLIMKYEVYRDDVITSLLPSSARTILDVPCGDGDLLFKAANRFKNLKGIDISKVRLVNAKKKLSPFHKRLELVIKDVDEGLPFRNQSIDVVTCNAAIGCFIDPEFFLDEVHRVLTKEGTLIIQIGNYAFLSRRLALLVGKLPKISSFTGFGDGGMLHYFTYSSLEDLLQKHGFEVVTKTNSGLLAPFRKIWPTLLASDIIYKAIKND